MAAAAQVKARCVVALEAGALSAKDEAVLLGRLPRDAILLYPEELGEIVNPAGADRAEHGKLR